MKYICVNCDNLSRFKNCLYPVTNNVINVVTGERITIPMPPKEMREAESFCGDSAKWYKHGK